jgi:lysophospholipase L1-like esterase
LRLGAFHAVRGGRRFSVPPGRRRLTLRLALPALELHVDDELRGWRQDLGLAFPASTAPGESRWARAPVHAVVVQAVSPEVREVGLTAFSDAPISRARPAGAAIAALIAVLAGAGGLGALVHPGTGRARAVLPALGPAAALVGALVPGGVPGLPTAGALLLGGAAAGALGSALAQRRAGRGLAASLGLALVQGALLVELGSMAMPEWRHAARARWDEGLGPSARWYHDPMLRRLNPWFLDSRFQRRAWPADPPAGVARVVVFGGSQTYGWGIPAAERSTFSDRLGEGLRARGHAVEVLNAAFPGVKSTTGLRWFEGNLRRYRPDVVVLNFVVNEFMDVDPHRAWALPPGPRPLLTVGGLLRALPGRLRALHGLQVVLAREYGVREMEQSLRAFIGAARGAGARPLLCVEPTTLLVETDGREIMAGDAGAGEAVRVHRRLGAELGVPVHEPLNDLRRHAADELFYDTMHLSKRGHAVVAEGLVGAVEPLLPAAARGLVRDSP